MMSETNEPTEQEVQRSRLRVNQVWKAKHAMNAYVSVVGLEQDTQQRKVRVHPCSKPQGGPTEFRGDEQAIDYDQFFDWYELFWEAGNKELGASTDLTAKLKQIRRDPGRAGRPIDLIADRRHEYEARHAGEQPLAETAWWQRLDGRAQLAARELSTRAAQLRTVIAAEQAELDRIEAALAALSEIETPRAGE